MNKLAPKIKEVMEFEKWLIVKLISGKKISFENWLYSSVWTLEKKYF
jgi:hypothetical protein